ncbi:MAG: iron-containing alcohol dehydrogenase [Lachnospiraceae bacterium]|nr:iron-containing alcohol dehydrogenase [Lachnospiraceae bacterium]
MQNFQYYAPTKVVFGKDTETETGKLIKEQGGSRVLLHYGGSSAKKSGLLDRICASLEKEGISYVCLGGVKPNPRLSLVREGIELCKKEKVDFLLAVGGGSVIDSAKAIGYGLANEGDVWDFYAQKRTASACMPVGTVLTIAAAGSEMSNSSVITKEEGWIKRGYSSNYCRCRFAVMNPELTYTLPKYQTASGCVDIILHTMERYFSKESGTMLTDSLAEGLMRTVMNNAKVLMKDPQNYEARAQIMWAGSLSHNGLTGCGMTEDWASHQLEHELSAMFDVAHGAGLAAIWGSWARYVYMEKPERFAQYGVNVLGIPMDCSNFARTALQSIEETERFFQALEMPISIHELGYDLTEEQLQELAFKCSNEDKRTIGGFRVLNREDMLKIYRMAK